MGKITLIGDVHGWSGRYLQITFENEYTVQLGDLGFSSTYMCLHEVDSDHHKIIPGNHDDYNALKDYDHFLGDFGEYRLNGVDFFFVRGAFSIDQRIRVLGINWWEEEELSYGQCLNCIEEYNRVKPKIMLTHDCPLDIVELVLTNQQKLIPSMTGRLLQQLWDYHKPDIWFFGHHHRNFDKTINGTRFVCLNECCTHDLIIK